MKTSVKSSTKITLTIILLLAVFHSIFPWAIGGSFMSLIQFSPAIIGFALYILLSIYLLLIGHTGSWFLIFLFLSSELFGVIFRAIAFIATMNRPRNEYLGEADAASFMFILAPLILYSVSWILVFRKKIREQFNVNDTVSKVEGNDKIKKPIVVLCAVNLLILLVGAILCPPFLFSELPHIILTIIALVFISKEKVAGYYLFLIGLIVQLYSSGLIIFYPGVSPLLYYFQISQTLVILVIFAFLLQKKNLIAFDLIGKK